jgi:predicted PurR-regulated permease PerM
MPTIVVFLGALAGFFSFGFLGLFIGLTLRRILPAAVSLAGFSDPSMASRAGDRRAKG